jgi:hypothetical protein
MKLVAVWLAWPTQAVIGRNHKIFWRLGALPHPLEAS